MLSKALQRQIARARALRQPRRTYFNTEVHNSLPPLSQFPLDTPSSSAFPLYTPPTETPFDTVRSNQRHVGSGEWSEKLDPKKQRALKVRLTHRVIENLPELEESDLQDFYAALIESGKEQLGEGRIQKALSAPEDTLRIEAGTRREILSALAKRILPGESSSEVLEPIAESSAAALQRYQREENDLVERILETLAAVPVEQGEQSVCIPVGLVSRQEWTALFEQAMEASNPNRAENILGLAMSHGVDFGAEFVSPLITSYASQGAPEHVYRLEAVLQGCGEQLSSEHHDTLLSTLVAQRVPVDIMISHLKRYEAMATPAPQSSYNIVLSTLANPSFSTAPSRALAWDLFAHMRLTAHPTPTKALYNAMITSCSAQADPQPERARDLWIEMTVEQKLIPEEAEYTAIIRALSSTKKDYLEAFELFRQMLTRHQEATYVPFTDIPSGTVSRWIPSLDTWKALLHGSKRAGDLERTRWVLSECLRLAQENERLGLEGRWPDEDMMASVFMTYAAWKPIVRRRNVTKEVQKSHKENHEIHNTSLEEEMGMTAQDPEDAVSTTEPTLPEPSSPKTSADAIREAKALFDNILTSRDSPGNPFREVAVTPRLVNMYVSVHLAHATSLETAQSAFQTTWESVEVKPNGWTYMQVLERCALGNRLTSKEDREVAFKWGKQLWEQYRHWSSTFQPRSTEQAFSAGVGSRQVERIWRAIIRLHALSNDATGSLRLMKDFHSAYPPSDILETYNPSPNFGLSIRFSDPTTIAESNVPPHLLFRDVDVVHQRLVRDEDKKGITYVKWFVTTYEMALRMRRKWRLQNKPGQAVAPLIEAGGDFYRAQHDENHDQFTGKVSVTG